MRKNVIRVVILCLSPLFSPFAFSQTIRTESPADVLFAEPYSAMDHNVIRIGLAPYKHRPLIISAGFIPSELGRQIDEVIQGLRFSVRNPESRSYK